MNCMFCGEGLSEEEESNFIHYSHEKVCDNCMKKELSEECIKTHIK